MAEPTPAEVTPASEGQEAVTGTAAELHGEAKDDAEEKEPVGTVVGNALNSEPDGEPNSEHRDEFKQEEAEMKVPIRLSYSANGEGAGTASKRLSQANAFADGMEATADASLAEGKTEISMLSRLAAEFSGTFFLQLGVYCSLQGAGVSPALKFTPYAIGGLLAIQVYTFGAVSGGMFNPAVSIAVCLSGRGKLSAGACVAYILTQYVAAMVAAFIGFGMTKDSSATSFETFEALNSYGGAGTCFFMEVFFTAMLCSTVLSTGTSFDAPNDYFGFAIGGSVTVGALLSTSINAGSFNPAITWGMAMGAWTNNANGSLGDISFASLSLYTWGPIFGALLAVLIFRGTRRREYLLIPVEEAARETPVAAEKLLAEFVGTFYLVLTVGLTAPALGLSGDAPVAVGLVLAIQIYTFGAISGGLFNPAVTLAVRLSGRDKISTKDCCAYVATQFAGAFFGGFIAYALTDKTLVFNEILIPEGNIGSCLMAEVFFTCVLAGAVLSTGTAKEAPNQYFGFAIGGSVGCCAVLGSGLTQGSFNPAVTWGIQLPFYAWADSKGLASAFAAYYPSFGSWMMYILGPFVGGMLAAGVFCVTRSHELREFADREADKIDLGHDGSNLDSE